jgi:hypothetical protein
MEELTETKVVNVLNNLVGKRFTMDELKNHLTLKFLSHIEMEDSSDQKDDCDLSDYDIIFNISNGDMFCDGDIYYLKTRDPEKIYITEVYWDFEP